MSSWRAGYLVVASLLAVGCSDAGPTSARPGASPPAATAPGERSAAEPRRAERPSPDFSVLPGTGGSGPVRPTAAPVEEPNESHATDLTVHEKPRQVP